MLIAYLFIGLYLLSAYLLLWVIPDYVMIFVIIAVFIHTFLGYFLNLYQRTKTFDHLMHAYGSFSYALLAYCTLVNFIAAPSSRLFTAIFVFTAGMALGVLVEIFEFVCDSNKRRALKLQKGLKDTNYDLIFDTIGSLCAGIFSYFILLQNTSGII